MPAALAAADLYCHPSRREGLPNALLEAMASGLPAVATDVDGTPEVMRHGTTGYLVGPGDPLGLADHLEALLAQAFERLHAAGRPVRLVDVAAGHGRYVLSALARLAERNGSAAARLQPMNWPSTCMPAGM